MNENKIEYDYIITPYPEKISRIIHLPYPFLWVIFSGILFLLHMQSYHRLGKDIDSIGSIIVFSALPALLAIAIIWFSKAMEKFTPAMFMFIDWPQEKILKWYEAELRKIFNYKWMLIGGGAMAAVILYNMVASPFWSVLENESKITFSLIVFFVGILGGGLLYNMVRIACMLHNMGNIDKIKVSVYQHPLTSVKAVGNLLTKISMIITCIYTIGISGVLCEQRFQSWGILLTTGFFGIIVMVFFIFPQYKIHKIMARVKHLRLRRFSSHLEDCLEKVTFEPSQDNVQRVRELFDIQTSLNGMGEWPFDTKLLIIIVTGIAIPILVAFIPILCEKLKGN
jgi:hypothetical protein